jgi:hypothetical protein
MAPVKRKYRTIYIVTAALMVALIGGYALAATSVTTGPTQTSNVTTSPTSGFSGGTVSSEQLVVLTAGMTGSTVAGNQTTGAVGLSGTTYRLAICTGTPCAAQNFRPLTPATETTGNWGEQIVLSVSEPATPAAAFGFDFSFTLGISISGAATTYLVFQGYLATGSNAAAPTIPVFLFMDLGASAATTTMSIVTISVVFNTCSTTTTCP